MIKRSTILFALVISINLVSFGQSSINSPYTRFGIGEIDRYGFNHSKAMGGISTGLREKNQINYMNPAALSAQDTMSFIFDIGIKGIMNNLKSTTNSLTYNNVNFDHIAIAFPVKKWWYASIGINPYSKVGYNYEYFSQHEFFDSVNTYQNNIGDGAINQLYIGNSFKIGENLSVGFNYNFLFGTIEHINQKYLDIPNSYSTVNYTKTAFSKSAFDLGAQYNIDLLDKYFLTLGATYSNQISIKSDYKNIEFSAINFSLSKTNISDFIEVASQFDTLSSYTNDNYKIEIPARISLGFTTGIKDKFTFGFDYSQQDWSNIESLSEKDSYTLGQSFNMGLEYIPNRFALRNYIKLVSYRAGFFYDKSYIQINNKQITNYGITFGLGLPIVNQNTRLNISYTYGSRGATSNGLIEENYSIIGVNLTLYDFWFIKRKFQ